MGWVCCCCCFTLFSVQIRSQGDMLGIQKIDMGSSLVHLIGSQKGMYFSWTAWVDSGQQFMVNLHFCARSWAPERFEFDFTWNLIPRSRYCFTLSNAKASSSSRPWVQIWHSPHLKVCSMTLFSGHDQRPYNKGLWHDFIALELHTVVSLLCDFIHLKLRWSPCYVTAYTLNYSGPPAMWLYTLNYSGPLLCHCIHLKLQWSPCYLTAYTLNYSGPIGRWPLWWATHPDYAGPWTWC